MFRLATLVAVAAAATVKSAEADADKDEAKAKDQVAKAAKTVKSAISGSSKVVGLEVPQIDGSNGKALTYADIIAHPETADYQLSCVFAEGATWEAAVAKSAKVAAKPAQCTVSADKIKALDKDAKLKTAQDLTLDSDLTYEELFAALESVSDQTSVENKARDSFVNSSGARTDTSVACPVAYDATTFGEKAQAKTGTVEYKWAVNSDSTAGQWCYSKTFLPKSFSGGLLLTHTAAADTQVAVKVDNTVDRYFNNASLKSMAIGKTGQIPLTGAESIEVYMAQNNKWVAADKGEDFKVTFTRASYFDIAKLTAEHGGAVTWIIIGCVVLVLCIVGCIVWKCFCSGKKDEEDQFYYSDDLYARV